MTPLNRTSKRRRVGLGLLLILSATAQLAQAAPTVTLTSPGAGWSYNAPAASIPFRATATPDAGSTITKVEFLANGNVLTTDTAAAYAWNWSNVVAGTYALTARVTDSLGQVVESAPVTLTITTDNQPPKVSLSAPADKSTQVLPATVTLTASASDSEKNGKVAKVDFRVNGETVASLTQSPWTTTWTPTVAGAYTLTAQATDNLGGQTTSVARTFNIVTTNDPPKVSLSAPANNSNYLRLPTLPVQIPLTVGASDVDANTPITQVDILVNGQSVKSFTQKPYTWTWEPTAGTYTLSAQATDSRGITGTVAARTIIIADTNTAPTVALTAPANNTTYALPADIVVSASASDIEKNDGVAKVEFFANGSRIGSVTVAPYKITWTPTAAGTISLTAVATDKQGASTTSAARTITLADANLAPKVAFSTPANNAKYLRLPQQPLQIPITVSASDVDANTPVTKVDLLVNGEMVQSFTQKPYTANWTPSAAGTYTLTATATDSRNVIGTAIARTVIVSDANTAPTVSLTAPANKGSAIAPANITVTASATAPEANDTVTKVDFYQGSTLIGTATQKPYSIAWSTVPPGTYQLTAKATDGQGATTTSAARTFTVLANQLPSISITSPTQNQNFTAGSNITLTATAADTDGILTKVAFYQGTTLIGSATSAPYTASWSNVQAGNYSLTAKATDSNGGETFSGAIAITVGTPGAKLYFIHADHLDTPRLVTDEQNNIVWRNAPLNEPFGNNPVEEDPNNSGQKFEFNLRFPGQYADKETNTNYNYLRDGYNPATGSYTQSDPLGLYGGSLSTYAYVGASPLSRIDPKGQSWAGAAAVVVVVYACATLYCEVQGTKNCAKKYPNHRDPLSPDRSAYLQCISGVTTVCASMGAYGGDPIGSTAVDVGGQIGKALQSE